MSRRAARQSQLTCGHITSSPNGIPVALICGVSLDNARRFLFVACGDHVVSLDAGHDGKIIDSIATGAGLDNIDYSADAKVLYAAAAQAATLTVGDVNDHGKFHLKTTVPTVKGARGVIAGKDETAYLIDPAGGRIREADTQVTQRYPFSGERYCVVAFGFNMASNAGRMIGQAVTRKTQSLK